MKAIALIVGIKEVDSTIAHGRGYGKLPGCEVDANNVEKQLISAGFKAADITKIAKDPKEATAGKILDALKKTASTCKAGDLFVFYYSGHGGQTPDTNGDEADGKDETLVCYDKDIIDDELDEIWKSFAKNVRIVMLSDSCHSGTNYKLLKAASPLTSSTMQAMLIHIAACADPSVSLGKDDGSVFTNALCKVFQGGKFKGNYQAFYNAILKETVDFPQKAQYNEYGPAESAEFKAFKNQRPLLVT